MSQFEVFLHHNVSYPGHRFQPFIVGFFFDGLNVFELSLNFVSPGCFIGHLLPHLLDFELQPFDLLSLGRQIKTQAVVLPLRLGHLLSQGLDFLCITKQEPRDL